MGEVRLDGPRSSPLDFLDTLARIDRAELLECRRSRTRCDAAQSSAQPGGGQRVKSIRFMHASCARLCMAAI